jgi:hypothetical protein
MGKAILRQFKDFLTKILQMQTINSNEAFVVSVSWSTFGGGTTSFVDVITKFRKYFHPIGPGWPPNPPNYVAFRWAGRLQSIHHVDRYEIITSWKRHFPDTTEEEIDPHFLYHLGPPIVPQHEVRTGISTPLVAYGPPSTSCLRAIPSPKLATRAKNERKRRPKKVRRRLLKEIVQLRS